MVGPVGIELANRSLAMMILRFAMGLGVDSLDLVGIERHQISGIGAVSTSFTACDNAAHGGRSVVIAALLHTQFEALPLPSCRSCRCGAGNIANLAKVPGLDALAIFALYR
jgi:hypothetical protein